MKATEFKDLLVREREERKMDRKEFAELLDMSVRSLQSYELGDRRPELNNLERILDILGYSMEIRKK